MAILNRVGKIRHESARLSQVELAKRVGISRQTLIAIERGHRLPSLEVAHRIAEVLGRSIDDVFHYKSELELEQESSPSGDLWIDIEIVGRTSGWESDQ